MADAALQLVVDSTDVSAAEAALNKFQAAGFATEATLLRLVGVAERTFDSMSAGAARVAKTSSDAASSMSDLEKQMRATYAVSDRMSSSTISVVRSYEEMIAKMKMGALEYEKYVALRRAGVTADSQAGVVIGKLADQHWALAEAARASAAGQAAVAKALATFSNGAKGANDNVKGVSGNLGMMFIQLEQATTQLQMGASPLTVLMQQGTDLATVMSMGAGGIGGTIKALGAGLVSFLTPAVATVTAIGVAALTAGLAWRSYAESQREAEQATARGVGVLSGASVGTVNRVAQEVGGGTNAMSVGQARDFATQLASTGKVAASNIRSIVEAADPLARTLGTSLPDAFDLLAKAMEDPGRGADALNAKLGFLDARTKNLIETLQRAGQMTQAQGVLTGAVNEATARQAKPVGAFENVVNGFTSGARNLAGDLGAGTARLFTPTVQQQIDQQAQRRQAGLPVNEEKLADLQEQLRRQAAAQSSNAATATSAKASLRIDDILKSFDQEGDAIKKLTGLYDELNDNRRDSGAGAAGADMKQASDLSDVLNTRLQRMRENYAAGGQAAATALRQADFSKSVVGANDFVRQLLEVNRQYDELRRNIELTGGAQAQTMLRTNESLRAMATALATAQQVAGTVGPLAEQGAKLRMTPDQEARAGVRQSLGLPNAVDTAKQDAITRTQPPAPSVLPKIDQDLSGWPSWMRDRLTKGTDGAQPTQMFDERLNSASGYKPGLAEALKARQAPGTAEQLASVDKSMEQRKRAAEVGDQQLEQNKVLGTTRAITEAERTLKISTDATNDSIGKSIDVTTRLNTESQLRIQYGVNGTTITEEQAAAFKRYASAAGDAALNTAKLRAEEQLRFDRSQLGRTDQEQQVQSSLRSRGIDPESDVGKSVGDMMRLNQTLTETKSLSTTALTGFLQDLRRGTSIGDAFKNQLDRILDRLLQLGSDKIISNLFGSALGGSSGSSSSGGLFGGLFGNLFGGGGGGGGSSGGQQIGNTTWFASGGAVRGPGGPRDDRVPAWLSNGEFVVNAQAAAMNYPLLHHINASGFARGGSIGGSPAPVMGGVTIMDYRTNTSPSPEVRRGADGSTQIVLREAEKGIAGRGYAGRGPLAPALSDASRRVG